MGRLAEIKNMTETSADLYFYGDIVSDWWGAWQDEDQYPDAIKNFLAGCDGKDLNVYINSGGGSVFAGIAIYNMLKRHAQKNKVCIYVDGVAGSIASAIAFAGSEPPRIPRNAYLFIHNPWTVGEGNAKQLRKIADDLDQIKEALVSVYTENAKEGVERKQIESLMDAESWLSGQQAAEIFQTQETEEVKAVAAIGECMNKYKNMPQGLKKINETEKETEIQDAKNKEKIEKMFISAMGKGV